MKDAFYAKIETIHLPDRGTTENAHGLCPELLASRDVVYINIANDHEFLHRAVRCSFSFFDFFYFFCFCFVLKISKKFLYYKAVLFSVTEVFLRFIFYIGQQNFYFPIKLFFFGFHVLINFWNL